MQRLKKWESVSFPLTFISNLTSRGINGGQFPDLTNADGNRCVAVSTCCPRMPHVCLITGVITQPNICLSHSPAARPYIYSWRPSHLCPQPPPLQSTPVKVLLVFKVFTPRHCCSPQFSSRSIHQTLNCKGFRPPKVAPEWDPCLLWAAARKRVGSHRGGYLPPPVLIHYLFMFRGGCRSSVSSVRHNIVSEPTALLTTRHMGRPEGHGVGIAGQSERDRHGGCGLNYGDKLSLPGDVLHSPSDVPSGQGEEVGSPACAPQGLGLMSCT